MQKVRNPVQSWFDITGRLADGGKIYVGTAASDPRISPILTYWDSALTVPATQPLRTVGGRIVNGTNPAAVFVAETDFAVAAYDSLDVLVDYSSSNFDGLSFQPLDADLTAIAALVTQAYGRSLLTLDGTNALVTEAGAETLTNKTLTSPIINGGSINANATLSDTGTVSPGSIGTRGFELCSLTPGSLMTLTLSDAGKLHANTLGGWAIPANATLAIPPQSVYPLANDSGSTQTVTIGGDDTLRLHGSSSTGPRTLAPRGFGSLVKMHSTEWWAVGDFT